MPKTHALIRELDKSNLNPHRSHHGRLQYLIQEALNRESIHAVTYGRAIEGFHTHETTSLGCAQRVPSDSQLSEIGPGVIPSTEENRSIFHILFVSFHLALLPKRRLFKSMVEPNPGHGYSIQPLRVQRSACRRLIEVASLLSKAVSHFAAGGFDDAVIRCTREPCTQRNDWMSIMSRARRSR